MRQDHTICTAVAPDDVFTVRTNAIRAAYDPILVFKFQPNHTQSRSSTPCPSAKAPKVSQVRFDADRRDSLRHGQFRHGDDLLAIRGEGREALSVLRSRRQMW